MISVVSVTAPVPDTAIDNGIVRPVMDACVRALATNLLEPRPQSRSDWWVTFPGSDYRAMLECIGGRLFVSPPFRNGLTADERADTFARWRSASTGESARTSRP